MLKRGFRGGYVQVRGGAVHYLEHGPGEQTIVMLHQGGSSSREFVRLARILEGWRVIMPDIPGHGNSSECEEASIERYAGELREFIDELEISRPVLFGHHFGGVVAVELAVQMGDRVQHLVLSNTPFVDEHARELRASEEPRSYIATQQDGAHLSKLWATRMALYGGDAALANRFIAENLLMGESVERAHAAVAAYRMEERFHEYGGKLTYIHGAADPYIAIEIEHAVARFEPDRLVTVPQGTVALVDQSPEEVAAEIARVGQ